MSGIAVNQKAKPCKPNVEYQNMDALAIIIKDYCVTNFGHIHLIGEKIYDVVGKSFKANLELKVIEK
jgi:hypothetical protein